MAVQSSDASKFVDRLGQCGFGLSEPYAQLEHILMHGRLPWQGGMQYLNIGTGLRRLRASKFLSPFLFFGLFRKEPTCSQNISII